MSRPVPRKWSIRRPAAALLPAVLAGILVGCGSEPKAMPVVENKPSAQAAAPGVEVADGLTNGTKVHKDGDASKNLTDGARMLETQLAAGEQKPRDDAAKTETGSSPVPISPAPLGGGGYTGGIGGLPAMPSPQPGAMPHPLATATPTSGAISKLQQQELLKGRSGKTVDRLLREGGGNFSKAIDEFPRRDGKVMQGRPPVANPADPTATAESYNMYKENEYRSPLVAPLSTFSADVNTASYSNVRRYLSQTQMPPKDAVFLAEFINYFPYDYAKPKGEDPIAYNLELGPCPWNRKHHLLRVGVQAFQLDPKDMPARKFTFLIDTSGSMSGENRLPLVKKSLAMLIDQLTDKDSVGLVTYAGTAGVALMPTKGSEKEKIRVAVEALGAGGSTNGEGGLKAAYELARQTFEEKAVNRVILCTDGDFNVGVSSQGDLVRMIEDQRKSGVFLTILGYGMGNYKDGVLKELANHGNGHHAYIDTIDEAKKVFVEQGGALVLVAKDVKFQVDFNPGRVAAYRLVGYENRLLKDEDFKNDAKDAGDMGSGHQVTVLYEIVPVGVTIDLPGVDKTKYRIPTKVDPNAPDEWLTVKMRYKQPDGEKSKELAQPLKGDAKAKDLSDDFRFAAAAASFGMLLRDSEFKGGMSFAGVLEEAQGAVGNDPNGHRKAFLEMVKQAQEIQKSKTPTPAAGGAGSN